MCLTDGLIDGLENYCMATSKALPLMAQHPSGDQQCVMSLKGHTGTNTIHVFISDVHLGLNALLANLQMMGQLICVKEGLPSREALAGLRSGST